MNIPNNSRKKDTIEKIEKAFINLIQEKNIEQINVTELVKLAKINRSTFYVNYIDIYDLAESIKEKMWQELLSVYKDETETKTHSYNFLKLFIHIKENQIYYKTLYKLGFDFSDYFNSYSTDIGALKYYNDLKYIDYHIEFFKAGLNAIIKKWLFDGCKDSPEDIYNILVDEYKGKNNI